MGDWIQESHKISIKEKYFTKDIERWNYTLNNVIYNINDSTNVYNLTASGDVFYISDILVNTINELTSLPTNLEIDSSSIILDGFIDFNFKNSDNTLLNIETFNMSNLTIEGCDFTNISLANCNFTNAKIKNTTFDNITINNSTFGFINNGGNTFNLPSNTKNFTKLEQINNTSTLRTFIVGPNTNLVGVDMTEQNLDNVDFNNSNLTDSVLNTNRINGTRFVNFVGTPNVLPENCNILQLHNSNKNIIIGPNLDITNSNLSNRDLTGFNFTNCSFSGVILEGANLTDIILSKTIGGPFSGTVTALPNSNYKILTTNSVNNYLIGSNMVIHTTDFGTFSFENLDISNIDLHSSILSQSTFQNSHIHLIDNSIPTISSSNGYKHIGNNILGPGLLIGNGPYQDVTIDVDLGGQDITDTVFLNCKLGPFDSLSNLPSFDSKKHKSVLNGGKYYIYGEDLDCTDLDLTNEDLTNLSLMNATVVNTIFTNTIIKNTKLFNLAGIPLNDPINYIFDDLADAYIGPHINYENLLVKNDHMFKIGTGYNDLTGIKSKNINWTNYDLSRNYQGKTDQLLPSGMKFKSGMILGRDIDQTNTKRIRTKKNITLNKNIKYKIKSIMNIPMPNSLKLDIGNTKDISFIFQSTNESPSQIISETVIDLGTVITGQEKENFELENIISLTTPSIIERDLSGNDLQVIENLQGTDFSGSNLSYVDFKLKNLTECNFSFTNLTYTDFSGAILTNCNFTGATLDITNFTNTTDLNTITLSTDQTNSTIILADNETAILPDGVTFVPDFSPGMGTTGKLTINETAPDPGSITLFNEVIRNVVPGRTTVLDFSFIDTTDLDKNAININILTTPIKGTFNKTTYTYYEFARYTSNIGVTGNEVIQWYLNTPNGDSNNATITFEFDETVVQNNAVIQNVDLEVEANNSIDIVLTGINVQFFEITQAPTNGSIILNGNRKIRIESTRIKSTDTITYTAFSTFGITEIFKFRAFGESGLYSNNRNINISIIEEVMSAADLAAVDNAVQNVLSSVLTDVNTGIIPQINVGNALRTIGGASKQKKKAALTSFIANLFSTFSGVREIKMSRDQMGLPSAMTESFSGDVKVVKPDPTIVNVLPDLSQESFYCNLAVGEITNIEFGGVPYAFKQKTTGVEVTPQIHSKSLYLTDESFAFHNTRILIGSTGAAQNNAPVFTSTPPNTNISIDDTFTYNVVASDSNGDSITISAPVIPDWMTFIDNGNGTGVLTGTALVNDAGLNNVSLIVTDGGSQTNQDFDIFVRLPDLLIWELGVTDTAWGTIPGKDYTYDDGAKYIIIKNNEPNVTVELDYYKLAFYPSETVIADQINDGGLTWVQGTGDFIEYEYAINTSQLTQIQHESAANALNANLATITNDTENTFIYNNLVSGNTSAWIGYYRTSNTNNFAWFDASETNYTNWSNNPDNDGTAVGALLGFLGSSVWIDELQTHQNNGLYKRLVNTTSYQFSNTISPQYIPLSGDLGPGKYLLITRLDETDNFPTPGDNFIGAFANPNLTNVLHKTFNYTGEWDSTYNSNAFFGTETVDLIVNNGNSPDYVVDRLGSDPVNGNINNFIWAKNAVKRISNFTPTQTFNESNWIKYDIPNDSSLLNQTPSIFTFMTLVPHDPLKINGYYPLYNVEMFAYNVSPLNTLTVYNLNNTNYYMPNGLILNETYFLGNYDDVVNVNGYYPLYYNSEIATIKSPVNTYHTHVFNGITYYMPDGLVENSTFFHGNYYDVFFLDGYYPLYRDITSANSHTTGKYDVPAGDGTSREIVINNNTYYMPNGLKRAGNIHYYYIQWFDNVTFKNNHYPLYRAEIYANIASPNSTSTKYTFDGDDYWMPNGLPTGEFFIGNYVEPVDVPCLTKDSTVKTPSGFVNICALKKYDIVVTNDGRHVPITKITKTKLTTNSGNSPYIIPKNFFGKNYPRKEFEISPSHAISLDNKAEKWFIPHIHGYMLHRHKNNCKITYYHIELPNWLTDHLVINNNIVVESYGDSYHKKLNLENPLYKELPDGYYKRDNKMYAEQKRVIKNGQESRIVYKYENPNKNTLRL